MPHPRVRLLDLVERRNRKILGRNMRHPLHIDEKPILSTPVPAGTDTWPEECGRAQVGPRGKVRRAGTQLVHAGLSDRSPLPRDVSLVVHHPPGRMVRAP